MSSINKMNVGGVDYDICKDELDQINSDLTELSSAPVILKIVQANGEYDIPNLQTYRFIQIIGTTGSGYITNSLLIPVALATQYKTSFPAWITSYYDGTSYNVTLNVTKIDQNKLTISLTNTNGCYVMGIK